jgi:hypothetical protein
LNFGEIVFIGNRITEGGKNWSEKFNIPNIRNRGIGGDVTDGVLERLGEIIFLNQIPFLFLLGLMTCLIFTVRRKYPHQNM